MNKSLADYFSSLRVEIGAKDCILMRDDAHTISTTTTTTATMASDYKNEKNLIHHHHRHRHHNLAASQDDSKSTTASHDYHVPIKAPATTTISSSPVAPIRRGSLDNPFDDFLNYNNSPSNILPPSAPCRRNSLPLTTTTMTTTNSSPPDGSIVSTTLSHDDIWGTTSHSSFSSSKNNHCLDTSPVFPVRRGSFDTATSPKKKSPTYLRQQQRSMPKVDMLLEWIHDPIILSPTTQQQQSQSVDATDIIMKNEMPRSSMLRSSYLINQIDDAIVVSGGGGRSSISSSSSDYSAEHVQA